MASPNKSKVIQVQNPAQSLKAFQAKLNTGEASDATYLKPVLFGVGLVLVVTLGFFGFRAWRASVDTKHEAALAELMLAVQGNSGIPSQPADLETRMRENLPKLESLAKTAPGSKKAIANNILASWRLQLDGKGGITPSTSDPWSSLLAAKRLIALGQGAEALAILNPLRGSANPSQAWSDLFWKTLLRARSLQGDRAQALKDYGEYKQRFREQADISGMERILIGI